MRENERASDTVQHEFAISSLTVQDQSTRSDREFSGSRAWRIQDCRRRQADTERVSNPPGCWAVQHKYMGRSPCRVLETAVL